jgi:hypothetical protein
LENYDIYKQFQALHNEKVNLLDIDRYLNVYMIEANLFLNQYTTFLLDAESLSANAAFSQYIECNNMLKFNTDIQFSLTDLPMLPQEYFLTKIIPASD